jgi:hypothetical protein
MEFCFVNSVVSQCACKRIGVRQQKNVFEVATAFGKKGGSDTLGRWTNFGPRLGLRQRASPGDGFFSELFLANKV